MAWIYLLFAGLLETAWAASLKAMTEKSSVSLAVFTVVAMAASLGGLYLAMMRLPLGVAYPIWTGIGAVGAVAVGVIIHQQALSLQSIGGLALLLAGMALLGSETQ